MIKFEKNRANNMIIFMLDPCWIWLINMCVEKLLFALLKSMIKKLEYPCSWFAIIKWCFLWLLKRLGLINYTQTQLIFFQMCISTLETTKEVVIQELSLFQHFSIDLENWKEPLTCWKSSATTFPSMVNFTCQIMEIVGNQIEI